MKLITVERLQGLDDVALVMLSRPEQRNALSSSMLEELTASFGDLAVVPGLRAVVVAGAGKDFCAGADLAELAKALSGPSAVEYGRVFDQTFSAIAEHPVPVIARIHGAALGAGCLLAVACDLAVAAEDARLGIPSARLGIVLSYESIERVVLALGPKRAAELLLTGRVLSGNEAAGWGLVDRVAPASGLVAAVSEMATAVAEAAPLSVRTSKRGIAAVLENLRLDRFAHGHRLADFEMMSAEALGSDDLREGIAAMAKRRGPRFRGK
jgi:enoyl-CoA hydratase/carnithine racemase